MISRDERPLALKVYLEYCGFNTIESNGQYIFTKDDNKICYPLSQDHDNIDIAWSKVTRDMAIHFDIERSDLLNQMEYRYQKHLLLEYCNDELLAEMKLDADRMYKDSNRLLRDINRFYIKFTDKIDTVKASQYELDEVVFDMQKMYHSATKASNQLSLVKRGIDIDVEAEHKWHKLLTSERSIEMLNKLAKEAKEEIDERDKTIELVDLIRLADKEMQK